MAKELPGKLNNQLWVQWCEAIVKIHIENVHISKFNENLYSDQISGSANLFQENHYTNALLWKFSSNLRTVLSKDHGCIPGQMRCPSGPQNPPGPRNPGPSKLRDLQTLPRAAPGRGGGRWTNEVNHC